MNYRSALRYEGSFRFSCALSEVELRCWFRITSSPFYSFRIQYMYFLSRGNKRHSHARFTIKFRSIQLVHPTTSRASVEPVQNSHKGPLDPRIDEETRGEASYRQIDAPKAFEQHAQAWDLQNATWNVQSFVRVLWVLTRVHKKALDQAKEGDRVHVVQAHLLPEPETIKDLKRWRVKEGLCCAQSGAE